MTQEEKRKNLVQQLEGHDVWYFDCWQYENGQGIFDSAKEYFSLPETQEKIDKRALCAIYSMMNTYQRVEEDISKEDEINVKAAQMYIYFYDTIMSWGPGPELQASITDSDECFPESFSEDKQQRIMELVDCLVKLNIVYFYDLEHGSQYDVAYDSQAVRDILNSYLYNIPDEDMIDKRVAYVMVVMLETIRKGTLRFGREKSYYCSGDSDYLFNLIMSWRPQFVFDMMDVHYKYTEDSMYEEIKVREKEWEEKGLS